MITRPAHAKLNVFLRVIGRREDGFHDIETVILPLDLHDVITVEPAERLEVVVAGPRAGELAGTGGEALVERAARAWAEAVGIQDAAVRITLDKQIPVAAGLGGGSADAAATILALEEIHGTDLDAETRLGIAAAVGSDVPALLLGGPVYAAGRGELVTAVHAVPSRWAIAPAAFAVRTPDAYAWWDADPVTGPDPGALIAALEAGNDERLGGALFDDLQVPVVARHPEVGETIQAFEQAGALGAVMSGSGPTVVALARHMAHADQLVGAVPGSFVVAGPPRTMGPPSGVV
ncbi:MAG: 4-(cytidine 5'-diphospho)-2-C-methyl-D-erythritol kinase [Actinomycetota bacterium]